MERGRQQRRRRRRPVVRPTGVGRALRCCDAPPTASRTPCFSPRTPPSMLPPSGTTTGSALVAAGATTGAGTNPRSGVCSPRPVHARLPCVAFLFLPAAAVGALRRRRAGRRGRRTPARRTACRCPHLSVFFTSNERPLHPKQFYRPNNFWVGGWYDPFGGEPSFQSAKKGGGGGRGRGGARVWGRGRFCGGERPKSAPARTHTPPISPPIPP